MTHSTIKTRFAPSPTGLLHLGNMRTALFNYLLAKKLNGVFLLRIEDTDAARSQQHYVEALEHDLKWLDLHWDEGVNQGGQYGPYKQSERHALYDNYFQQLIDKNLAYPCFCTEHELTITRKMQLSQGKAPRYLGTCAHLSTEEIAHKRAQGIPASLRFRVPTHGKITFTDLVKGEQAFSPHDIGDFVIRRSDNTASFMFCNAIDDALMHVTYAVRGEDHLTNTPRQIMILQALGLPHPQYGHISLIMGSESGPLSKREGAQSIAQLRERGYLPDALINYLARLGHYYAENTLFSLDELAQRFSVEQLGRAAARFDMQQLHYWQKEALKAYDNHMLWAWMEPAVKTAVPKEKQQEFVQLVRDVVVLPEDAIAWVARAFAEELPAYSNEAEEILAKTPLSFFTVVGETLSQHPRDYHAVVNALQTRQQVKGKALFQPLRAAIMGQLEGPEMQAWLKLVPEYILQARLQQAKQLAARD
jgi:nondiscriminating glutamyl-tRNA synthetase